MPLSGYSSLCEQHQKIIVSKDSRQPRMHRAINKDGCNVSQYQIDGVVISDKSNKCDFLVMNDDKLNAYLIELKGIDIEHAVVQLEGTANRLKSSLSGYTLKYRLVYSAAKTHALQSTQFKRFRKLHSKSDEFKYHENILEENI